MDDILEELLADFLAEFPDPGEDQPFIDLDDQVPAPLQPQPTSGLRFLTTPKASLKSTVPPRFSPHGGLKEKTRATLRLPMVCMSEPAG